MEWATSGCNHYPLGSLKGYGVTPSPVVCTCPLVFVILVYSWQPFSTCGALGPDFDGIGLLGDKLREATDKGG
jgi:hypothetical protein